MTMTEWRAGSPAAKPLSCYTTNRKVSQVVVVGDIVIIEREGGEIKRSGEGESRKGSGGVRWPWRCFRNLIASTFAYLSRRLSPYV